MQKKQVKRRCGFWLQIQQSFTNKQKKFNILLQDPDFITENFNVLNMLINLTIEFISFFLELLFNFYFYVFLSL